MASAFLGYAHSRGFVTAHNISYSMDGLVMLSSGGQFCYAYDKIGDLANASRFWGKCTPSKIYGCCPEHLTEDFFWHNPQEYGRHPPTLLVQSEIDYDADGEAAQFCELITHGPASSQTVLFLVTRPHSC